MNPIQTSTCTRYLLFISIICRISAQFNITNNDFKHNYDPSLGHMIGVSRTIDNKTITAIATVTINHDGTYSTCKQIMNYADWSCTAPISKSANDTYQAQISYIDGQDPNVAVIGTETDTNHLVRTVSWDPESWYSEQQLVNAMLWPFAAIFITVLGALCAIIACGGIIVLCGGAVICNKCLNPSCGCSFCWCRRRRGPVIKEYHDLEINHDVEMTQMDDEGIIDPNARMEGTYNSYKMSILLIL